MRVNVSFFCVTLTLVLLLTLSSFTTAAGEDGCEYTTWSEWTPCDVACGMGKHTHARTVKKGGAACKDTKATANCDAGPCPYAFGTVSTTAPPKAAWVGVSDQLMFVNEKVIVIAGGVSQDGKEHGVSVYDLAKDKWTSPQTSLPLAVTPEVGQCAVQTTSGVVYVFGGSQAMGLKSSLFSFSLDDAKMEPTYYNNTLPPAAMYNVLRDDATCAILNGVFYVYGSCATCAEPASAFASVPLKTLGDVDRDPATMVWTITTQKDLVPIRSKASLVSFEDRIAPALYLVGSEGGMKMNDTAIIHKFMMNGVTLKEDKGKKDAKKTQWVEVKGSSTTDQSAPKKVSDDIVAVLGSGNLALYGPSGSAVDAPVVFEFDFAESSWSEVVYFPDQTPILGRSGLSSTFQHNRFVFLDDKSGELQTLVPEYTCKLEGHTCGDCLILGYCGRCNGECVAGDSNGPFIGTCTNTTKLDEGYLFATITNDTSGEYTSDVSVCMPDFVSPAWLPYVLAGAGVLVVIILVSVCIIDYKRAKGPRTGGYSPIE